MRKPHGRLTLGQFFRFESLRFLSCVRSDYRDDVVSDISNGIESSDPKIILSIGVAFAPFLISSIRITQHSKMVFLHLFIVNKSGGLVHHRALSDKAPQIGTNEWLRIGSTFHSLHAIAAEASPIRLPQRADDGIEEIQALGMILRCLQTRTGVKFVIT